MEKSKIKIDKGVLAPEDYENTKLITLPDGSLEEVYISRAGNIVTAPKDRALTLDVERQQKCWDYYVKSLRSGRPSARQAALDAGFSANTALNIRAMKWFKDRLKNLQRKSIGGKAERNLSRGLDVQWSKIKLTEEGDEETVVDKDLFRTVMDVSKFVAGTLLKDEGYSTKTEVVGNMDSTIKINSISYADNPVEIENKIVEEKIKEIEGVVLDVIDTQTKE
jgi:phage terminase small subunit